MSSIGWILIKRFSKVFTVDGQEVNFDFLPMNVRVKQLYQVYAQYEGAQIRFHLQINNEGEFRIMDTNACPAPYRSLEAEFSAAIIESPQ